jgi:hypothetical protein
MAKPLRVILESDWVRRAMQGKQGHTRVYPAPQSNRIDEHDLFQNVKLDEKVLEHA